MRSSKFSTPRLSRVTPMLADRRQLRFGERAGLALERDLFGASFHGRLAVSRSTSRLQLLRRQKRRRAAAEVDEVEAAARRRAGWSRVELPLARQQVEVLLDLAARSCRCRPGSSRNGSASGRTGCAGTARAVRPARAGEASAGLGVRGDGAGRPDRKRRVIRDEIAADLGLLEVGNLRRIGHACTIPAGPAECLPGGGSGLRAQGSGLRALGKTFDLARRTHSARGS